MLGENVEVACEKSGTVKLLGWCLPPYVKDGISILIGEYSGEE